MVVVTTIVTHCDFCLNAPYTSTLTYLLVVGSSSSSSSCVEAVGDCSIDAICLLMMVVDTNVYFCKLLCSVISVLFWLGYQDVDILVYVKQVERLDWKDHFQATDDVELEVKPR